MILSSHNVPFGDINDPGPDMQPPLNGMWQDFREGVELLTASLRNPAINREKWLREARLGESPVTELADAITRKTGCGFRDAHARVKVLLGHLHGAERTVDSLTTADLKLIGLELTKAELASALNPAEFIARRTTFGGPAPSTMTGQLASARARLEADRGRHDQLTAHFVAARQHLEGGSL